MYKDEIFGKGYITVNRLSDFIKASSYPNRLMYDDEYTLEFEYNEKNFLEHVADGLKPLQPDNSYLLTRISEWAEFIAKDLKLNVTREFCIKSKGSCKLQIVFVIKGSTLEISNVVKTTLKKIYSNMLSDLNKHPIMEFDIEEDMSRRNGMSFNGHLSDIGFECDFTLEFNFKINQLKLNSKAKDLLFEAIETGDNGVFEQYAYKFLKLAESRIYQMKAMWKIKGFEIVGRSGGWLALKCYGDIDDIRSNQLDKLEELYDKFRDKASTFIINYFK